MKKHSPLIRHGLVVLMAVVLLIAGHGIVLYYFSSHAMLSASVVAGIVVVAVLKHLGVFGSLYALWRRRPPHSR